MGQGGLRHPLALPDDPEHACLSARDPLDLHPGGPHPVRLELPEPAPLRPDPRFARSGARPPPHARRRRQGTRRRQGGGQEGGRRTGQGPGGGQRQGQEGGEPERAGPVQHPLRGRPVDPQRRHPRDHPAGLVPDERLPTEPGDERRGEHRAGQDPLDHARRPEGAPGTLRPRLLPGTDAQGAADLPPLHRIHGQSPRCVRGHPLEPHQLDRVHHPALTDGTGTASPLPHHPTLPSKRGWTTMFEKTILKVAMNGEGVIGRRGFLRGVALGAAGLSSVSFTDMMALQAEELRKREMACILLWMAGGPSQLETSDPKPGTANGGDTKAIDTIVPGIRIANGWDKMAKVMSDVAIVRSMTNKEGNHQRATYQLHTGYAPTGTVKHPSFGAAAAAEIGDPKADLPNYVTIAGGGGPGPAGIIGAGLLGPAYEPFPIANPLL